LADSVASRLLVWVRTWKEKEERMSKIEMSVALEMLNLIRSFKYLNYGDYLVEVECTAEDIAEVVQRWLVSGIIHYPERPGVFIDGNTAVVIPAHTLIAIQNYIERKLPPGDFLYAVLSNNLKEAYRTADDRNRSAIEEIVRYLCNYAPATCWGSKERVYAWLNEPAQEGDEDHEESTM
jgi:hypothetical protein